MGFPGDRSSLGLVYDQGVYLKIAVMAKRFNRLTAALKYLRPLSGGEGATVPDAPAGTALKKFQDYKSGKVKVEYTRSNSSRPGEILDVALRPFAFPAADTRTLRTTMSTRARSGFTTFELDFAKLGLDDTPEPTAIQMAGFKPARAICRNTTGTTPGSLTPSKITGQSYRSRAAVTYTFPIGRTTAEPTWGEQKSAIANKIEGLSGTKSVSFKPEVF
jgi:hypothetical protein